MRIKAAPALLSALLLLAGSGIWFPALALVDSGSDGLSGALVVSGNTTINLANAVTGDISDPGNPNGVYDPDQWAIVFEYSSVTINGGATLTFTNHPSGAPVVWLVAGDVTVNANGVISLNGANGTTPGAWPSEPGPGGFRGGQATQSGTSGGGGMGPGGGIYNGTNVQAGNGSYSTAGAGPRSGAVYGNPTILPLIGGSGGAANGNAGFGVGSGGGAILIVANGTITVNGTIRSNGGNGYSSSGWDGGSGSGGAIRLIAGSIVGNGSILAIGGSSDSGSGGLGRIRLEANSITHTGPLSPGSSPGYSFKQPLDITDPIIWPGSTSPRISIASINGVPVPADPNAEFLPPADVNLTAVGSVPLILTATNVPTNATVEVKVTLKSGQDYKVNATFTAGDANASTWTATLTSLPQFGFSAIQARAVLP